MRLQGLLISNGRVGAIYAATEAQITLCMSNIETDIESRLVILYDDMEIAFKRVEDQIRSRELIADIDSCTNEVKRISLGLEAITVHDPPTSPPQIPTP